MSSSIVRRKDKKGNGRGSMKYLDDVQRKHKSFIKVNHAPKFFCSKTLKLIPSELTKAIEFLLYMKPSLRSHHISLISTPSQHSLVSKYKSPSMRSTCDLKMKLKMGGSWQMLNRAASVENRIGRITRSEVNKTGDSAISLFQMRTDPWPDKSSKSGTFTVKITETSTVVLYIFHSRAAIEGTEEAILIHEQNTAYSDRVKTYKKTYDVEAQTPFRTKADRYLGTTKNTRRDTQIQVSYSDIYDTFKKMDVRDKKKIESSYEQYAGTKSYLGFYDSSEFKEDQSHQDDESEFEEACRIVSIVESDNFMQSCLNLSRNLDRTINMGKQMRYFKGVHLDPLDDKCPILYTMEHLWTLRFMKVWGMPVTSICVNRCNNNIVAVGHGMYFMDQPKHLGRVSIWNLKNCSLPEKYIDLNAGVTCLSFSRSHPFILLASLVNGKVKILDISNPALEVIASCLVLNSDQPLWYADWFTSDLKREQPVVCGSDGNMYLILEYSFTPQIFLKFRKKEGVVKGIPLPYCSKPKPVPISLGVTCCASYPGNYYNYLAGTDDGCVHHCSMDFWDNHIDVFQAHIGPVHQIKFHPHSSKIFLTVGIDHFVRVWAYEAFECFFYIYQAESAFEDADWSPVNPNIIATVSSYRVTLWDLSRVKVVPQNTFSSQHARLTSVLFSSNGFNLICGDLCGDVHIYSLSNMPFLPIDLDQALKRTLKRILLGKKGLTDRLRTLGHPFDFV